MSEGQAPPAEQQISLRDSLYKRAAAALSTAEKLNDAFPDMPVIKPYLEYLIYRWSALTTAAFRQRPGHDEPLSLGKTFREVFALTSESYYHYGRALLDIVGITTLLRFGFHHSESNPNSSASQPPPPSAGSPRAEKGSNPFSLTAAELLPKAKAAAQAAAQAAAKAWAWVDRQGPADEYALLCFNQIAQVIVNKYVPGTLGKAEIIDLLEADAADLKKQIAAAKQQKPTAANSTSAAPEPTPAASPA